MPIALNTLATPVSTAVRPYTSGTISPSANALVLVMVSNTGSVSDTSSKLASHLTSTFAINGSWAIQQVADPGAISRSSIHVWWAVTTSSPGSGTITINTGASPAASHIAIVEFTGIDTTTPMTGYIGPAGSASATGTLTLTAAPTASDVTYSVAASRNDTNGATAGSGMTLHLNAFHASPSAGLSTQQRTGSTSTSVPYAGLGTVWNAVMAFNVKVSTGGGTTPVTATRATTWHTLAAPASTRATTWHARAEATGTRATTWNARATVEATRATTWTANLTVTASRATTWNVAGNLASVTATRATTWHAGAVITSSRATTWNARQVVTATRSTTFTVAAPVTSSRATAWTARAAITATRATTWQASATVAASRATTWTTRAPVTSQRTTTWNVAGNLLTVSSTRATTWTVRAPVTATRATTYTIRSIVTDARSTTWTVRRSVEQSAATTWAVNAAALATRSTTWAVRSEVSAARATTWAVDSLLVIEPDVEAEIHDGRTYAPSMTATLRAQSTDARVRLGTTEATIHTPTISGGLR